MSKLPDCLTDQEFWTLSQDASEPGGYFRSADITNLTSNELWFQHVIPDLVARVKPGGVYLGVGPEQNFTYMAALRPKMAIIFDIRRGNLDLQLMYKAMFELSTDRADFVSMLFAKPRPAGLGRASTAARDLRGVRRVATSQRALREEPDGHQGPPDEDARASAARARPGRHRGRLPDVLRRTASTLRAVAVLRGSDGGDRRGRRVAELSGDRGRLSRSLKDLQSRNLVVPVVGDFGGPKAIRAIGEYLKSHGATVAAFYLSNVEQYLVRTVSGTRSARTWPRCRSTHRARSSARERRRGGGRGGSFINSLGAMLDETRGCAR